MPRNMRGFLPKKQNSSSLVKTMDPMPSVGSGISPTNLPSSSKEVDVWAWSDEERFGLVVGVVTTPWKVSTRVTLLLRPATEPSRAARRDSSASWSL